MQGLYANIHLHNLGSEMQGARRGQASQGRRCRLLPTSQEVMKLSSLAKKDSNVNVWILLLLCLYHQVSCVNKISGSVSLST